VHAAVNKYTVHIGLFVCQRAEHAAITSKRSLSVALQDIYESLTDEQKEKARACKTPEDALELAKEAGYELSDFELEGIACAGWDACSRD